MTPNHIAGLVMAERFMRQFIPESAIRAKMRKQKEKTVSRN
jgi:hypothetical protein